MNDMICLLHKLEDKSFIVVSTHQEQIETLLSGKPELNINGLAG